MKIWGRRSSFNVQKVRWVVDHLGLPYEHVEVGGKFGGLDTEAFRALNPHRKVPVLADGELLVWESHTIIRYLAARFGPRSFWREDLVDRTYIDRWLDWTATRLQPDFMSLFWGYYRAPQTQRDKDAVARARSACAQDYELLNDHLRAQKFLAGDEFSLADVPAGATLFRYLEMGLDVPRPTHMLTWYERLCAMPSYRRQIMIPFEELRGRITY